MEQDINVSLSKLQIEYDAFGVPINSSGYAGLGAASSADIDEAVRSILT